MVSLMYRCNFKAAFVLLNLYWLGCIASFVSSASEMEQLQISPAVMLEDEISWLDNFEPTWTSELETSEADNILLAGHLHLIKTLLSLCGNEKEQFGQIHIYLLL